MDYSKYIDLLTESPTDVIMESPSPPTNCISLCNNNLFPTSSPKVTNTSEENVKHKPFRHPGQAIKILADTTGHKLLTNEVGKSLSLDIPDSKLHRTKSLIEYIFIERKTHAKSDIEVFV